MDLKFVESLIAVVDGGSIAGAARGLNVTGAAISQRVSALEVELGVPLLVRAGRTMAATPECEAVLPELREMLRLRQGLASVLSADRLSGTLRLGAVSTALGDYGPAIVTHFKIHAPEVELSFTPGSAQDLFARFEQAELDAVLIVAPPFELPKTMRFDLLAHQAIGVLARRDTPEEAPYIVYDRAAWGGAACWQALQDNCAAPKFLCDMDAVETIAQMVRDGLGQAVLPKWGGLAAQLADSGAAPLVFRPLGKNRAVGLITWHRDTRRPIVMQLRQALGLPA